MADGRVVIDIEANSSGFENELDGVEDRARDAGDGLSDLGDGANEAAKGLDAADVAAGSFVADALMNLISGVADAAKSLVELAGSTREYREDMAKLQAAFSTAGHSTDTAAKAYEDMFSILGESDRSVEAVNHLAELTKNEEELAKWSTISAGVVAKFGDSLPIEGLTEAANHTAKLGEVQGPLADALEWIGISTDEFNAQLAECNTEQERATLITETLNSQYASAAEEYNKLTASTQEANRATSAMEQAQANVGAALEPVTTAWLNLKANAMEAILPVVQVVSEGVQKLTAWLKENETAAAIITTVIIALAAALGVLAAALGISTLISTVQKAFAALNLTMLANPITLIVAALAALVAAFLYLWNNVEGFREFWIKAWETIKKAATDAYNGFTRIWNNVKGFFTNIYNNILGVFSSIKEDFFSIGDNIINGIWNGLKSGWTWLTDKVSSLASGLLNAAKNALGIKSPSRKFAYVGEMSAEGIEKGWEDSVPEVEKKLAGDLSGLTARIQASVGAESVRAGQSMGRQETGFTDLARAVVTQTAGINSLSAEYRRGAGNMRPVVLQLNGRELGRAVVDVSGAESARVGTKLVYGGA